MILPVRRAPLSVVHIESTNPQPSHKVYTKGMYPGSQLSSITTALLELTERVSLIADTMSGSGNDEMAVTLYEVERSLTSACRRLDKVVDRLT